MKKLENLPQITDRALDGLKADETLKTKILNAALQERETLSAEKPMHLLPVLLTSVAVMLLCVFLLNGKKPLPPEEDQHIIHSFSAGNSDVSSVSFDVFYETEPDSIKSIEFLTGGKITDRELINQMMELLKLTSEPVDNIEIKMNDQLDVFGPSGLMFSLQTESPYIKWSDGIRKCELFFEAYRNSAD